MIKREMYMERIRPFIGQNIVKVLTGIRRCGKSVMLTLIQNELKEQGISEECFLSINFESKAVSYVSSVDSTYEHIKAVCEKTGKKVYLFLDEIQELCGWEPVRGLARGILSCYFIDFICHFSLSSIA